MRFITHEAVSALAQYPNVGTIAPDLRTKVNEAIATLRPDEQKALVKHYIVQSCKNGCDHGGALQEGLKSLSHYYPTGNLERPALRR